MENKIFLKIKNKLPGFALLLIVTILAVSLMYLLAACTTEDAATAAVGTATAGFAGLMGVLHLSLCPGICCRHILFCSVDNCACGLR